jgi:pimeloyl-ACP methyl ester carboxylesterase
MIGRRLTALAAIFVVIGSLVSCSSPSNYGFDVAELEVAGPDTLGLSDAGQVVKGVVVYFHGSDQTAQVIKDDRKHTDFFDPILRAGYAVVAADADGNAFGNPASQDAYRKLVDQARQKYVTGNLFYVAESMGGIAALTLLSEDKERAVKGVVGISPLMGLPPAAQSISYIAGSWGGTVPPGADPLGWAPITFSGRQFRLYAARGDKVIPPDASARAFYNRFASVAKVAFVNCGGGHVAADCYRGDEVVKWMSGLT